MAFASSFIFCLQNKLVTLIEVYIVEQSEFPPPVCCCRVLEQMIIHLRDKLVITQTVELASTHCEPFLYENTVCQEYLPPELEHYFSADFCLNRFIINQFGGGDILNGQTIGFKQRDFFIINSGWLFAGDNFSQFGVHV